MASTQRLGRAVGVLLVVLSGAWGTAWLAAPVMVAASTDLTASGADPAAVVASVVTVVAAAALAFVACWVATATTWCVVRALRTGEAGPAARAHPFLTPLLVRVLVGAALGTTALAGPAAAAPSGSSSPEVPPSSTPISEGSTPQGTHVRKAPLPHALAGLPLPDRPIGATPAPESAPEPAPEPTAEPAPAPVTTAPQLATGAAEPVRPGADARSAPEARSVHTVAPGESLWAIAAEHLPPGTPPAVVDRWWRALYDANRPGIGADPDLIRPGTVLRLPRPLA